MVPCHPTKPRSQQGPSLFGMKTILLVDDDEPLRTLFGLALRKNGYYVIEADSGVAGFEMARKHLPDVSPYAVMDQCGFIIARGRELRVYLRLPTCRAIQAQWTNGAMLSRPTTLRISCGSAFTGNNGQYFYGRTADGQDGAIIRTAGKPILSAIGQ
jgi:hypothetical protein